MKKVVIFLVLIVSLSVKAQIPKDSIVLSSQVFQAENFNTRCYQIFKANFGNSNDALMWQYNNANNQSKLAIYKTSQYGFSVFPWNFFTIPGEINGVDILKTSDSINSIQAVYADTLFTLRSNSSTPTFSIFKEKLTYQPVMIRNGEINSQLAGDETLIVDSTGKEIYTYHFNGATSDILQRLSIPDLITCLEFGDFNGDNLNDLVVVYNFFSTDSLIPNHSVAQFFVQNMDSLVFWQEIHLNKKACSARAVDLQGDGFCDLIISSTDSLTFGLTVVNFIDSVSLPTFDGYNSYQIGDFTIGDLNRDSYLDIIGRRSDTNLLVVYRNDQNGTFVCDGLFQGRGVPQMYHSTVLLEMGLDNRPDIVYVSDQSLLANQNITPYYADLEIISLGFSNLFQLGNNYQQSMTLKIGNIGEAMAADDSLSARITFSIKSLADSLITEKIINQAFDSLAIGDSLTLNFVLDSIFIPNGSKLEILVQINPDQQLTELTLKNNFLKNEWQFAFPDLTISEIQIDTNEDSFLQGSVRIDVENIGCEIADSSNTKIKIFLKHGDSTYYSEEFDNPTASLNPNEKTGLYFYLGNLPDSLNISAQDSLIVEIFVDYELEIEEADESNNELSLRLYLADFLSLTPISEVADFSVYPNPTNGIINLVIPTSNENLEIYNSLGQRIWSQKVAREAQIDLSNLPNGWYCLKIGNLTKKIIKK